MRPYQVVLCWTVFLGCAVWRLVLHLHGRAFSPDVGMLEAVLMLVGTLGFLRLDRSSAKRTVSLAGRVAVAVAVVAFMALTVSMERWASLSAAGRELTSDTAGVFVGVLLLSRTLLRMRTRASR